MAPVPPLHVAKQGTPAPAKSTLRLIIHDNNGRSETDRLLTPCQIMSQSKDFPVTQMDFFAAN